MMEGFTMSAGVPSSAEQARQLVAEFVLKTCTEARDRHGHFSLDEAAVDELHTRLTQTLGNPGRAAELVDRSLRYIAFFLADCGMHGEAMKAAVGVHHYRAHLMRSGGHKAQAWATRLTGMAIGVTWDPLKVMAYSFSTYLALAVALLLTSIVTYGLSGESAIVVEQPGYDEPNLTPGVYEHLYFAAVTLTTLGYGDVHPNHRHWWGVFPATISALGGLAGYVILAGIVAVIMNRSGIHPYARIGTWMEQFEKEVIGEPVPLFRWSGD
jgi:hypothetical protein